MVDAPEMTASDPVPGRQAGEYNQQMVDGKTVSMVKDTTDRDDFGRSAAVRERGWCLSEL